MRRIWLYSLIAFVSLILVGVLTVGIGSVLNSGKESPVSQVNSPTVSDPSVSKPSVSEPAPEETKKEQKAKEQKAAQEQKWREIAKQRDDKERSAAERRAAEQQVADETQPTIPTNTALSLTVPSAGIQNDPVTDSIEESVLANGAGKIPSTGFPWQSGANTYSVFQCS